MQCYISILEHTICIATKGDNLVNSAYIATEWAAKWFLLVSWGLEHNLI